MNKKIVVGVSLGVLITLGIFLYVVLNSKDTTLSDKDRVKKVENITYIDSNTKFITNKECSGSKKYDYSLTLNNDQVLVENYDTFENFVLNIKNVKQIEVVNYTNNCQNDIYVLLTNDGKLYFTNNEIVSYKNIRNIDKAFHRLDTKYTFDSIGTSSDNKLYGKSNTEYFSINVN